MSEAADSAQLRVVETIVLERFDEDGNLIERRTIVDGVTVKVETGEACP